MRIIWNQAAGVLLKLTRISLIIVLWTCVNTLCWLASPGLLLLGESWDWESFAGFSDLSIISSVQPVPGSGKLLLRRKIKALDWETMPWFDDVGSHYYGQFLDDVSQVSQDWPHLLPGSCASTWHQDRHSWFKLNVNFENILILAYYGQDKTIGCKYNCTACHRTNSVTFTLSLMHSHIFCDFLLQN